MTTDIPVPSVWLGMQFIATMEDGTFPACRSLHKERTTSDATSLVSTIVATSSPVCVSRALTDALSNIPLRALIGKRSSESFISKSVILHHHLKVIEFSSAISMVSASLLVTRKATVMLPSNSETIHTIVSNCVLPHLCLDSL